MATAKLLRTYVLLVGMIVATALLVLALAAQPALSEDVFCDGGTCRGTPGDDYIGGSVGADRIIALAGFDSVWASPGDDRVFGGPDNDFLVGDDSSFSLEGGEDVLRGGNGDDSLYGDYYQDFGPHRYPVGDDTLFGGRGNDGLAGQTGSDLLRGGPGGDGIRTFGIVLFPDGQHADDGRDTARGGAGNDTIYAADPEGYLTKDFIHCGRGTDAVSFDKGLDEVSADCEIRDPQNQPAS